jgi:hypothetical protein
MEWNTSTIRMENFERRQKGLPEIEPTLQDLFGKVLADRHSEVLDLAEDAARGLRALVLSVAPEMPRGASGRPVEYPGLAEFALRMRSTQRRVTNKEIAAEWKVMHPDNPVTDKIVKDAVTRFKRKQQKAGQKPKSAHPKRKLPKKKGA